ncbi:MAG TPA: DUF898 family protein [Bacteriovoracaceae bacterium]|nr:DUF898 family protein [Bacteriovoracaceae bacterium]
MIWKLVDVETGYELILSNNYSIGRIKGDSTFPDCKGLSGQHCKFVVKDNEIFVMDLRSTNGTKVGAVRIPPHEEYKLESGCELKIGSKKFKFEGLEETSDYSDTIHIKINVPSPAPVAAPVLVKNSVPAPAAARPTEPVRFSYRGEALEMLVLLLKNMFLTILTLGIYVPYAKTNLRKHIWSSTYLGKYSFQFFGNARELLKGYSKLLLILLAYLLVSAVLMAYVIKSNVVLNIVSSVVSSLLIGVLMIRAKYGAYLYILNHTSYRSLNFNVNRSGAKEFVVTSVTGMIFNIMTLGLYIPFYLYNEDVIKWNNTSYGNQGFKYTAKKGEFARLFYQGAVLTVVTLGLYFPWFMVSLHKFRMANLKFQNISLMTSATGSTYLWLMIKSSLLVLVTFGLAAPFVFTMNLSYYLSHLTVKGTLNFESILEGSKDKKGALSEGAADLFDLGSDLDIA